MLSTPGIGSGLDISTIIDQLMVLERRPLVTLGAEEVELQAQLSAYGSFKGAVSSFQSAVRELNDPNEFQVFSATTGDENVLTASADASAAKGAFAVEVNRIAENHRLAAGTTFVDQDTTLIGSVGDTIEITVGSDLFVVDFGDKTLSGVAAAINDATTNSGVTASILQDDAGYHLTLSADETGSSNFISVTYGSGVSDPFALATLNNDRDSSGGFTSVDLDAQLTIEGSFVATRSSNTVTDVIQGVTLGLVASGSTTLDVSRDDNAIEQSAQAFINSYNTLISAIDDLGGGVLATERASLGSIETSLRNIMNTAAGDTSSFDFLFELGVSTKLNGSLELDSSVFQTALESDPNGVAELFANAETGLAVRFDQFADELLDADGLLIGREESITRQISDLGDRRIDLEFRILQKEEALVAQFSALDALLAQLQTTSSFLTTQLAQIEATSQAANGGN
ncbi:MAG: flagellar filament capping protein FliD [Pseudomonadota bacterium]